MPYPHRRWGERHCWLQDIEQRVCIFRKAGGFDSYTEKPHPHRCFASLRVARTGLYHARTGEARWK